MAALVVLSVGIPASIPAQVITGKVQGRVTDAATGAPIAAATVLIDGTTLGNLTNEAGYFFINDVPAGLQSVRARFIGYRSFLIDGQRILAGQTHLRMGLYKRIIREEWSITAVLLAAWFLPGRSFHQSKHSLWSSHHGQRLYQDLIFRPIPGSEHLFQ